jgi:hypothetical protein
MTDTDKTVNPGAATKIKNFLEERKAGKDRREITQENVYVPLSIERREEKDRRDKE